MRFRLLAWSWPFLLLLAACGPYRTQADATFQARGGDWASYACGTAIPFDDEGSSPPTTPTPHFPNEAPPPAITSVTRLITADRATFEAAASMTAVSDDTATPVAPSTPCSTIESGATADDPSSLTPVLAITATPRNATETPIATVSPVATSTVTPAATPEPTGTSAVATATARARREAVYLSIGDGIQWGCCGPLGSSAPSLFADHLMQRLGRPVFWQSPGSGYETTDTFITGRNGQQPQLDAALELMGAYPRMEIPLAALTMSIGGNNLVDIGRNCAAPPCIEAFAAGLTHLREQLHVIYGRITAAKPANVPLFVLLYYDANECSDPGSGAAVDAWNTVIAEVATQYGAFLVDARSLFRGHCDWIDANGLDASAAGHAAIAAEYARVYDALPSEYKIP
jgi:hypothetical protein